MKTIDTTSTDLLSTLKKIFPKANVNNKIRYYTIDDANCIKADFKKYPILVNLHILRGPFWFELIPEDKGIKDRIYIFLSTYIEFSMINYIQFNIDTGMKENIGDDFSNNLVGIELKEIEHVLNMHNIILIPLKYENEPIADRNGQRLFDVLFPLE